MRNPRLTISSRHIFLSIFLSLSICANAQVNFTANDKILPYTGGFRAGVNFDIYRGFTDEDLATLAAGNEQRGVQGVGIKAARPGFFEDFAELFGYDIRVDAFKYYDSIGLKDNTMIVGFPSKDHRDPTFYCPSHQSTLFKNMDAPIWDGGKNGTPVNDTNYYALYIWKTVTRYKNYVKFWEVWNEPGYDYTGAKGWLDRGFPGNWWENNPDPCDYKLRAPIFSYVRLLRITYEVVKSVDPNAYVMTSGLGYPSFLDAILRNSDNPDGGKVTPQYPLKGGAYFDGIGYHAYPHFDDALRRYSNEKQGFEYFRHSDAAGIDPERVKNQYESVLKTYGYDGQKYPKKVYILTETNLPRKEFGEYIGSSEAQKNWIIKATVNCIKNDIWQMHIFKIAEETTYETATYEFDVMGLYKQLDYTNKTRPEVNDEGIAYRTASNILFNLKYDSLKTKALSLPPSVDGGAFRDSNGIYTYVLWAKTTQDKSEIASATYSFPTNFNLDSLNIRDWQFSSTKKISSIFNKNIALNATPIFLTEKQISVTSQFICEGNSITFNDKTPSVTRTWTVQIAPNQTVTETAKSFNKIFNTKGKYTAILSAKDGNGVEIARQTILITVEKKPTADFSLEIQNPLIKVKSLASANAEKISWDFGDGTTSNLPELYKIYQKSGNFNIIFKAENYCGSSTLLKTVAIKAPKFPASDRTANQKVEPYNGVFRAGVNMRFVEGWTDEQIADIAAGNIETQTEGVGAKSLRTALPEYFTKFWGTDIRVKTFNHFGNRDLKDIVLTIGSPDSTHRDPNFYCFYKQSFLFKNMYLDIWDDGSDGTAVNDSNYFARYVYDLVKLYKDEVKFWEILDTPGWDFEGKNGWKPRGWQHNWWENDPDPCELGIFSKVQHVIRMHRIAYEIIKKEDPSAYILFSGAGFPSFLDAILRNTDNPEDGKVTDQFPNKGGAYFDAVSFNVFPHFDGTLAGYDPSVGKIVYKRHSDAAAHSLVCHKMELDSVLNLYGYNGQLMPKKHFLIGEINVPRKPLGDMAFGSDEVQKNFIIKSYITAVRNDILQMNIKSVSEEMDFEKAADASQIMGLYQRINGQPFTATKNVQGIAFKTTSDILFGLKYDSVRTNALNLNEKIRGAAFKNNAGKYTYVLWAATKDDMSEFAKETYSFPSALNINTLYMREWSFCMTKTVSQIPTKNIELGATPIFLSEIQELSKPPIAGFDAQYQKACPPMTVKYANKSADGISYLWTFPGGTPATSTEPNPSVMYQKSGVYDVLLETSNAQGKHTNKKLAYIATDIAPKADFDFKTDNTSLKVSFNNKSTGSFTMIWDFGDGSAINQSLSPEHIFKDKKEYTVRLIAINDCGRDTVFKKINLSTSINDIQVQLLDFQCFPNPFGDFLTVKFNLLKATKASLDMYDLSGKMLEKFFENSLLTEGVNEIVLTPESRAKGMYILRLKTENTVIFKQVVKF